MKVIQYRFLPSGQAHATLVGEAIQGIFTSAGDGDLTAIHVNKSSKETVLRRPVEATQLKSLIMDAFLQSFADDIDYSKWASVRSNTTCRFVVIEEFGLLRMCYASDDRIVTFDNILVDVSDVSDLLVNTDLFDFL
jgi:hypothetical protein